MEVSSFPFYLLLFACPEVYFVTSYFAPLYTLATIKGDAAVQKSHVLINRNDTVTSQRYLCGEINQKLFPYTARSPIR